MKRYARRIFEAPAALEDDVAAELWRLGATGCETKALGDDGSRVRIEAYFPADLNFSGLSSPGVGSLGAGTSRVGASRFDEVREIAVESLEDRDWLADYRAGCQPFDIGQRFRIDPRDADVSALGAGTPTDRLSLRLPAENAFGTGSHESTRLMLEWLEALAISDSFCTPSSLLDVGVGSGILSFAAELLGATRVVGFDLDAASVITARRNGERNSCHPTLLAGTAACLRPKAAFDMMLVNVLPERILGDLPHLVSLLRPGGLLISSGNLVSQRSSLLPRFTACGLVRKGEKTESEWLSWLFIRRPTHTVDASASHG